MKLINKTNIIYLDFKSEDFIEGVFDLINCKFVSDESNKIFYSHADILLQSIQQMQQDDCVDLTAKEPVVFDFMVILDMGDSLTLDKTNQKKDENDENDPDITDIKKLWLSLHNVCGALKKFSGNYGFAFNVYAVWVLPELLGFSEKHRADVGKELEKLSVLLKTENRSSLPRYDFLFTPDNRYQKLDRTDYQSLIRIFIATFITSHAGNEIRRFLETNLIELTSQKCFYSIGMSMLNNTSAYQQSINLDQSCKIFIDHVKKQNIDNTLNYSGKQLIIDGFFSDPENYYTYLQEDEYLDDNKIPKGREFLYDFIYKIHEKIDAGKVYEAFSQYFETWLRNQITENHFVCGNIFREIEGLKLYLEQQLSRVIAQDKERLIDELIKEKLHPAPKQPIKKTFFQKAIDYINKFNKISLDKNIVEKIGLLKTIFFGSLCSVLFIIYNGLIYWFLVHQGFVQANNFFIYCWTGFLLIAAITSIITYIKIIAETNKPKIVKHTPVNIPRFLPQKFVNDIHNQICKITTNIHNMASAVLSNVFADKDNIQNHSNATQDRGFPAGLSLIDSSRANQLFLNEKSYAKKRIDSYFLEYHNSQLNFPDNLKDFLLNFVTSFEKFYTEEIANEVFTRQMSSMEHELLLDKKKMIRLKDGLLRESSVFAIMFHQDYNPDYLIFPSQNGEHGFKGSYSHDDFLYKDMINNMLQGADVFNTPLIQIKGPFSINDLAYYQIACDDKTNT